MAFEALEQNINHLKRIVREMYVFTNQMDIIKNLETEAKTVIDTKEKMLLISAITALTEQLVILNNSIPSLLNGIGFYKRFPSENTETSNFPQQVLDKSLIRINYQPKSEKEKISLTIDDKDRLAFLENLTKSNLSINKLKEKYTVEQPAYLFVKPSFYAKLSNKFFRNFSNKLISEGHFSSLNKNLRKMNSPFVIGTYVSMMLFTMLISFAASILFFIVLLFFKISILFPFLTAVQEPVLSRVLKTFWVLFVIPIGTGLLVYFYPLSEGKNIGSKIDQELPFVAIHMSAIATSGIEPISIFKIILKNKEYKYTNIEFRKLMNLINFHGFDIITALRRVSSSCSSFRLRELLDGFATTMTSGGDLHVFLDKHADSLLFDYRLEREKYTKTSETFMDIYISVVIAAPMILLMLFVIMGSTGTLTSFMGLSVGILSFLIILAIVLLNVLFLIFLKVKQPKF